MVAKIVVYQYTAQAFKYLLLAWIWTMVAHKSKQHIFFAISFSLLYVQFSSSFASFYCWLVAKATSIWKEQREVKRKWTIVWEREILKTWLSREKAVIHTAGIIQKDLLFNCLVWCCSFCAVMRRNPKKRRRRRRRIRICSKTLCHFNFWTHKSMKMRQSERYIHINIWRNLNPAQVDKMWRKKIHKCIVS